MNTTTSPDTIRTDDLEASLNVGDVAYKGVEDTLVRVTDLGTVGEHRVAVLSILSGEYRGAVDVSFAGDLTPETHAQSDARWHADPDSIGRWPAYRNYLTEEEWAISEGLRR